MDSSPIGVKKKKTLNACHRCRNRKIKCSGQIPCHHCVSRNLRCTVDDRGKRTVVSQEYLSQLQSRVMALETESTSSMPPPNTAVLSSRNSTERSPSMHRRAFSSSNSIANSSEQTSPVLPTTGAPDASPLFRKEQTITPLTSPTVVEPGQYADQHLTVDDHGQFRYYPGHSSTWAFSRRIRMMVTASVGDSPIHDEIHIRDGVAYNIPLRRNLVDLTTIDLPSEDFAEYLANTVSFSLGSLYYLFDKDGFVQQLHQFYSERDAGMNTPTGLWHIQLLLVFALGKSILAREASKTGPTGMTFFSRALEALPDFHMLFLQPILAVEVLCMLALFMQAADMTCGAFGYIGQALRIALYQGMNKEGDLTLLTPAQDEHRRRLWWTVYIMDRRLTTLVGVPSLLHDEDICLPMPPILSNGSSKSAMGFHVKLSSHLGQILDVVYSLQRQLGGRYIAGVQSILQNLAETSILLNRSMKIELHRPTDTISRAAASLHLLHHQCSILAIRPVLFSLLEKKLTARVTHILSDAVIGLLRMCVESALQILKIIEALRSHNLLDLFLPFDLDAMFSGAFVLVLIDIITPAAEQWDLKFTLGMLDEMFLRGIAPARAYKTDLVELNDLRMTLRNRYSPMNSRNVRHAPPEASVVPMVAVPELPSMQQDLIWSWMATEHMDLGGLHPDTIQSAIDGLNFDGLDDLALMDHGSNGWMWGGDLAQVSGWGHNT